MTSTITEKTVSEQTEVCYTQSHMALKKGLVLKGNRCDLIIIKNIDLVRRKDVNAVEVSHTCCIKKKEREKKGISGSEQQALH